MNTQLWLKPEQIELILECLRHVKNKLNEGTVLSDAHRLIAGPYTYRRIEELIALIESKQKEPK